MARTWAHEKAYCEKRANELKEMMIDDIKRYDKNSFGEHMSMALNYMKKKDRQNLMTAFISHYMN